MQVPRIAVTAGGANPEKAAHNYVDRLVEAGAEPVLAVPGDDFEALFDTVDGLMLTGGTDIDTYRYGERPVPELLEPDLARDAMEISLLETALRRDMPVLAICRGQQLLNVALGGRLQQHISGDGHRNYLEPPHESRFHTVMIEEGSLLAEILGGGVRRVNSRHHQAVRLGMLGEGLLPSAFSPDGIVEGLESPTHRFVLAVQWHPERPEVAEQERPLFEALVRAIREMHVPAG